MSSNKSFKIITFSDITIDKITVPISGGCMERSNNNLYFCHICNRWLSLSDGTQHRRGRKHLNLLDGRTDHIIHYAPPPPTEDEKIAKIIKNTTINAIHNVKKRAREKYYGNEQQYTRITGLDFFDGISSVEKLLEHQGIILEKMDLPDLDVRYGDGDSCPYGCANHSYQRENLMLSRVQGLKIAMHILITNFGKNIAMEGTSEWETPMVSDVAEKVYYDEDPCWSNEYYNNTIAIEDNADAKRTEERIAAYAQATEAANAARMRVAAKRAEDEAKAKVMAKVMAMEKARVKAVDKTIETNTSFNFLFGKIFQ